MTHAVGTQAAWLTHAGGEAAHRTCVEAAVALLDDLILEAGVHTAIACTACDLDTGEQEIIRAIKTLRDDRNHQASRLYEYAERSANDALARAAGRIDGLAQDLRVFLQEQAPLPVLKAYACAAATVRDGILPPTHAPEPGCVSTAVPMKGTSMSYDSDSDFSQTASPVADSAAAQPEVEENTTDAPQEPEGDHDAVEAPVAELAEEDGAQ